MQYSLVIPYLRASPVQLPRRDLVLAAADSVLLAVSIIESDDPSAEALVLTGGVGGPALRMSVWADGGWGTWDYGGLVTTASSVLWSGVGVPSETARGTFEILIPVATMASWPPRCVWAIQLDWEGATRSETLALGRLHVSPWSIAPAATPTIMLTDPVPDPPAVLTDDPEVNAIYIDGAPPS